MKKRGGVFFNYISGILLFSLVIVSFYTLPSKQGGFWTAYDYSPPSNSISNFDKSNEMDNLVTDISCDINTQDSCTTNKANPFKQGLNFIGSMVQGAYAGVITISQSFTTSKGLVQDVGVELNVPTEIIGIFTTLSLAIIVIAMLLIIFNRSDAV